MMEYFDVSAEYIDNVSVVAEANTFAEINACVSRTISTHLEMIVGPHRSPLSFTLTHLHRMAAGISNRTLETSLCFQMWQLF